MSLDVSESDHTTSGGVLAGNFSDACCEEEVICKLELSPIMIFELFTSPWMIMLFLSLEEFCGEALFFRCIFVAPSA